MLIQRLRTVLVSAVASICIANVPDAAAVFIRSDVPIADYLKHTNTYPGFAAAGFLLQGLTTPFLRPCSGTLVAPTLFLTAAHCVAQVEAKTVYVGFDDNFPSFTTPLSSNVAQIDVNPSFVSAGDAHDMAIVHLRGAPSVAPASVLTLNPNGNTIAFLGYGSQGTSGVTLSSGFTPMPGAPNGLGAFNTLDRVTSTDFFVDDFDGPGQGPLHLEGVGGPGDSGAGAFLRYARDGQVNSYLIGLLVGGSTQTPAYGSTDFWVRVREERNLSFLKGFEDINIVEVNIVEPSGVLLALSVLACVLCARGRPMSRRSPRIRSRGEHAQRIQGSL